MLRLSDFARSCQLFPSFFFFFPPLSSFASCPAHSFLFFPFSSSSILSLSLSRARLDAGITVRRLLFIYARALSVCVGLSNIHLSCAAITQSPTPHIRGMKRRNCSFLSWNTPLSRETFDGEMNFVHLGMHC